MTQRIKADALRVIEQENRLAMEISGLKRHLKERDDRIQGLRRLIDESEKRLEVAFAIKSHVARPVPPVKSSTQRSESAAVVNLGDWHSEETIDPRMVNGKNAFNLEIASDRIRRAFENALALIDLERKATRIDTLIVNLIGDFMTGYIHEELLEGNSLSPTETILFLIDHIVSGLTRFIKESGCKRIIVICVVGNHGRTTQKKRIATSTRNSFEWLMYKILSSKLPQIEWNIADGSHAYQDVFGFTIRVQHGDAFKYQGGIGGITIPVLKAIPKWNGVRRADIDVFGHWHQFVAQRSFVSNGCLIGYSPFALEIKAEPEPPSQTFFLINREHGRTITTPIFLA